MFSYSDEVVPSADVRPPASKSARTRARLRDIALASFRANGYDATTIRQIAHEAGMSVGATHYHFASKNVLVQELYLDVQERHRVAATPGLDDASDDLFDRLRTVYLTGLDQLSGYHAHAGEFVSAALSPRSEINPLSEQSVRSREIAEELFERAVAGARHGLPDDLANALPRALFLAYLLLALFWVYDSSPGQETTRRLVDRGLALLKVALPLARVPLVRRPIIDLLALVGTVTSGGRS